MVRKSQKDEIVSPEEKFKIATKVEDILDSRMIGINDYDKVPKSGMKVYGMENDKSYILGEELGRGGEGSIYRIDKNLVCKIYKPEKLQKSRIAKLQLMVDKKINVDGICWPIDIVKSASGYPVGYIMKEAKGYNLSKLQNQYFMSEKFPKWKKSDIAELVLNILKKIKYLHDRNVLIGDINARNIMVVDSSKIFFVDTDSYQIEGFPCPVGTNEYVAKEIAGKTFSKFLRTKGNENFSIAVLIFLVLINGKHPYSYIGGSDSVTNIMDMKFPYPYRLDNELEKLIPAGPWKMIWESYPDYLKKAFYNVFSSRGENNREDTRLRVDDWIEVIEKYVEDLNGKLRKTNSNELFLGLKKVDKAIARMKTTPVKISAKDNYDLDRYNKR